MRRSLAGELGVSGWTLSMWETAERTARLEHLPAWADRLGCRIELEPERPGNATAPAVDVHCGGRRAAFRRTRSPAQICGPIGPAIEPEPTSTFGATVFGVALAAEPSLLKDAAHAMTLSSASGASSTRCEGA